VVSMRLYHLHPLLPVAVLVGVCLCVYLLMRYLGGSKSDLMETVEASAIHPLPPPLRNTSSSSPSMAVAVTPLSFPLNLPEPYSVVASPPPIPSPQPMVRAMGTANDFPSLPPLAEEEEKETSTTDSSAGAAVLHIVDSSVSSSEVDRFFISDEEGDHSDGSSSLSEGSSPSESSSSSLSSCSSVGSSEIIILERKLSPSSDHPFTDT
jgi:hypothetical protein